MKPDEGIFDNVFSQNKIPSPFSAYNIKTKLKVKAVHLVDKLFQKIKQMEGKEPYGESVKALKLTAKDIRLYFYCDEGNRWWFENR